ncbi:MAG: Stealth CR1 domain-containing protein [Bacteroidaceae bacterium]|nr:Stealth CR1 domain-containing protein [Bacteroidaceae bacterium]
MRDNNIDIVIPWVDGSDPEWQNEFKKYRTLSTGRDDNSEIRYRDWNNLQYLLRGIERFAPWVRKVHLVTTGQKPKWLNVNAPKLNFVKHEDFIPTEYLPTFSVRPIELNLHRIEGLSEQFIYFNDDYFLLRPVKPERFFRNGLPCDMAILDTLPMGGPRGHMLMNDMNVVIQHFHRNSVLKSYLWKFLNPVYGSQLLRSIPLMLFSVFPGFRNQHMPQAFLKSTLCEVWEAEEPLLREVSSHRFRDITDVNQYMFRFWQLMSGKFHPTNIAKGTCRYNLSDRDADKLAAAIRAQKSEILVMADSEDVSDFHALVVKINAAFDAILPEKSSFE